jgi:hypothetical protein
MRTNSELPVTICSPERLKEIARAIEEYHEALEANRARLPQGKWPSHPDTLTLRNKPLVERLAAFSLARGIEQAFGGLEPVRYDKHYQASICNHERN